MKDSRMREKDQESIGSSLLASRDVPFKSWGEAILVRTSRRDYSKRLLTKEELCQLHEVAEDLTSPSCRIVVMEQGGEEIFKDIVGSYGIIRNATTYGVFLGREEDPTHLEKTGYYGQAFLLTLTSKGFGTCWMAGFFKKDRVKEHIHLLEDEKILAVTPIGPVEGYSLKEKVIRRMVRGHRRHGLERLCRGLEEEKWSPWMERALNLARLAPSALNRQPWRFTVDKDSITVGMDAKIKDPYSSKRLDCGIAMLHLEVGASLERVKGQWEFLPSPGVARFVASL